MPPGAGRTRVAAILPSPAQPLRLELRSAVPVCPEAYLAGLATGAIQPAEGGVARLDAGGLVLTDGTHVAADVLVAALGNGSPKFPFFPPDLRATLVRAGCALKRARVRGHRRLSFFIAPRQPARSPATSARPLARQEGMDEGGVQLYRHVIAPGAPPGLAFAGFNHGFIHLASCTLGAIWAAAVWDGQLALPPVPTMEAAVGRMLAWKREHVLLEPARNCGVNTRFQQYNDIMCQVCGALARRCERAMRVKRGGMRAHRAAAYAAPRPPPRPTVHAPPRARAPPHARAGAAHLAVAQAAQPGRGDLRALRRRRLRRRGRRVRAQPAGGGGAVR